MTIEGLVDCMSWVSSIVLLRMPLILSWSILRFFSLGCVGFGLWGEEDSVEELWVEVSELSGVVGSVIYEASVLVGLSEDEELVGWELSREVSVVSDEV